MVDVRTVRVALAGCGTVGSGVTEIVVDRGDELAGRTGLRFEIVKVLVADVSKERYISLDKSVYTDNPAALAAADADMLVEVIGGTTTAREVVMGALNAGRPVVTANKALLALHGAEIYRAAREHGTCIAFESSCAGGLPIIGALLRGLTANRIDSVTGIFNSTCNYVLTEMLADGKSYESAIAAAQRLGYAEADPTLDVSGGDTAHKLTILASLAFGLNVDFAKIAMTGIDKVQLVDLRIAEDLGYSVKLLGVARRIFPAGVDQDEEGRADEPSTTVHVAVRPTLVPQSHPIAGLRGTSSGVEVFGDALGQTFYSGAGAGALPTASGVVADMVDVASGAMQQTFSRLQIYNDQTPAAEYADPAEVESSYYVRLTIDPTYTTTAEAQRAWQRSPVPLRLVRAIHEEDSIVAVTKPLSQRHFRVALQHLAGSMHPVGEPVALHVMAS